MAVTTDDSRMPVKFDYEHLCTVIKDVGTQTDDLSVEERDATREMKNDEEENINEKKMEERKNDEINTYAENSEEKTEEKDDTEEDMSLTGKGTSRRGGRIWRLISFCPHSCERSGHQSAYQHDNCTDVLQI